MLIIGGGATGLGVGLDAVSRGFRVVLVEKRDFCHSTSSRSTKLLHVPKDGRRPGGSADRARRSAIRSVPNIRLADPCHSIGISQ
ncbi:MAG: hypothetical protein CMO80_05820 [Verrucomicrobiales bacterium]|nr:hypothetical protein [Verrucomicrobiales bacterium]